SFCDGGSRFSTIPSCPFPCPVKTDKSWKIKEKNAIRFLHPALVFHTVIVPVNHPGIMTVKKFPDYFLFLFFRTFYPPGQPVNLIQMKNRKSSLFGNPCRDGRFSAAAVSDNRYLQAFSHFSFPIVFQHRHQNDIPILSFIFYRIPQDP